jgi:hypothetical protein
VNIAALMAALEVADIGATAKHALVVICARADRYTGMARVGIPRVAADMGRSYNTARAALGELVEYGYLTVDKSAGRSHLWMLTPSVVAGVPHQSTNTTPSTIDGDPINLYRGEGVFRENQGAPSRRSRQAASDGAGENLPAAGPALRLVNPGNCRRCLGTGWAVGPGGQSYQCHHRDL